MAGPGGVGPIAIPLQNAARALRAVLNQGQSVRGIVQSGSRGLFLSVAGARIDLPKYVQLSPGDSVDASLVESDEGPRLRLVYRDTAGPQTRSSPQTARAMGTVFDTLSNVPAPQRAAAAAVLSPNQPIAQSAVRLLANLFAGGGRMGPDLARMEALVREAIQSGRKVGREAEDALRVIRGALRITESFTAENVRTFRDAIRQPLEQRLAGWIARGGRDDMAAVLQGDLRTSVHLLRGNEVLRAFLSETGRLVEFMDLADRTADRITASQIQNSRGDVIPYQFLELPLNDPRFQSVRLHIFGDEGGEEGEGRSATTAVLDLETHHLGPLWVTIQTAGGACHCYFKSPDESVVNAVEERAAELEEGLKRSGYGRATITATLWDRDRLAETAALMACQTGVDLRA